MMEARAVRKYIRSSPRKLRRIVNVVRGESVGKALRVLHYLPQSGTRPVELAIRSAVHNLMDKNQDERFDEDDMYIREIQVDEGPVMKRFRAGARGRPHPYKKRMSHVRVVVAAIDEE